MTRMNSGSFDQTSPADSPQLAELYNFDTTVFRLGFDCLTLIYFSVLVSPLL